MFADNFFLFLKTSVFTTLRANRAIIVRSPTLPPGSLWAVEMSFSSIATPNDVATSITLLIVTVSFSGIIPPCQSVRRLPSNPLFLYFLFYCNFLYCHLETSLQHCNVPLGSIRRPQLNEEFRSHIYYSYIFSSIVIFYTVILRHRCSIVTFLLVV